MEMGLRLYWRGAHFCGAGPELFVSARAFNGRGILRPSSAR